MIKHHPTLDLLQQFVMGELPASLSAAVAMHNELCSCCQHKVDDLTEQQANLIFAEESQYKLTDSFESSPQNMSVELSGDFLEMMTSITANSDSDLPVEEVPTTITVKGHDYKLPRAIKHMPMGKWNSLGKLARSRVNLDEGEIHTSLLQIEAGGVVPEHTHKGFELTLLLDGSFKDERGEYQVGDFIMLDASHQHNPVTENGCLCYTVANAPQHFVQGFNKLLNPIGSLIY